MKTRLSIFFPLLGTCLTFLAGWQSSAAEEPQQNSLIAGSQSGSNAPAVLWQIGKVDNSNTEFSLAPGNYHQFKADGLFIVGESDSKKDWPYVQPGPGDSWAGNRPHTFTVLFGLKAPPADGKCQIRIALLDTQNPTPPKLRVQFNGHPFEKELPQGGSDASIEGDVSKGKPFSFSIECPANLLHAGDNTVTITTVGGSWFLYDSVEFVAPVRLELAKVQSGAAIESVEPIRAAKEIDGKVYQPVEITLRGFGTEKEGKVTVPDGKEVQFHLPIGTSTIEALVPAVSKETEVSLNVQVAGTALPPVKTIVKPVKHLTVYILPHSHTDIGYTEIQTAIEKKQVNNLLEGMAAAKRTANYPKGARFVWNVEVAWAADLYLHRLNETQRANFFEAVKTGQVVLNGMYLNELTGLCRPEEMIRLFRYSTKLGDECGVKIDSVMISDVPGYSWGLIQAMAQAGIKYFSTAPNYYDRIGSILVDWENKPFYWVAPDGKTKVLVWIPFWGYAMSHRYRVMSPQLVEDLYVGLDQRNYPYEIAYTRWSGHGDNAVPDPEICEFIKDWNAKYTWPHFIISGTSEAFSAFEKRYGNEIPQVHGDWTPYWEDGAGSSALETAMNRNTSDRIAQDETLFAMNAPKAYPATAFENAWRNTLLYSEHTWGADCSVWEPEREKTKEQWAIKRGYAVSANQQSQELQQQALASAKSVSAPATASSLDVYNTLTWSRTELVTLSKELSSSGNRVVDDSNNAVPSQRLTSGELAFLAKDVPSTSVKRYHVVSGEPLVESHATAEGNVLDNGLVRVKIDDQTGGIAELTAKDVDGNLVDSTGGETLNDYRFLVGNDVSALKRNGPVSIRVGEAGPLVASLIIESTAPGCKSLKREVRIVAGQDHVEIINTLDKERLNVKSYTDKEGKESANFAFPFNVPDGDVLLDVPFGTMRPDVDQIPSACKNWFSVNRWADVSNDKQGITWVTLDAPLVELGGVTANLLNSQHDPETWLKKVGRTQKVYSWVLNNHWHTNYRAYQEGLLVFRFILRPHRSSTPAEATRFATGFSQPLLPAPSRGGTRGPLLQIDPASNVIVTALKPSDDGKALIVRLFGASAKDVQTELKWAFKSEMFLSDTSERPLNKVDGPITVPAWGLVTLRVPIQ